MRGGELTNLLQVRGEKGQGGGEQALDTGGPDAVEAAPDVEAGGVADGDPAEDEDRGGGADGDEDVDGADAVGGVVGGEAAGDADAVEDEEQVQGLAEGEGVGEGLAGEGGQVVEGEVDAQEELLIFQSSRQYHFSSSNALLLYPV